MAFLRQIIQLMSEPPGSLVYHLVTLFALQATLGIALNWQRQSEAKRARRIVIATAVIFLLQISLLVAALVGQNGPATAPTYLLPLTHAAHTATLLFLIWAIAPHPARLPRLGHALLVAALIMLAVMTISFWQTWRPLAATGQSYNSTPQATIWGALQLVLLGAGLLLILSRRPLRRSLYPFLLGVLFLAFLAHLWNYPEIVPSDTEAPYWIRLGYLIAFPLWAAQLYRQVMGAVSGPSTPPALAMTPPTAVALLATMLNSLQLEEVVRRAVTALPQLTPASFAGVALADAEEANRLHLTSNLPQAEADAPRSWRLHQDDWPAFQLAQEREESVVLRPNGLGARQLYLLQSELGVAEQGAMLIHPLQADETWLGLLLLGRPAGEVNWDDEEKTAVSAIAAFLAQAIQNSRRYAQVAAHAAGVPLLTQTTPEDSGRLIALEEERDRLRENLEAAQARSQQAESRAAAARRQAQNLADTLEEMERIDQDERVAELEREIAALRESLMDAEEAMAMAAANEAQLSPEWVMLTITRYSSQLEEAQARIAQLEASLNRATGAHIANEVTTALAQELRTPMTSIAGFTDLLLNETVGSVGARQRDFLQRIKANTERMGVLLEQLVEVTGAAEETTLSPPQTTDVSEVIDTAVHAVITQIREKQLRLDLDVAPALPSLPIQPDALRRILVHLLDNACRASRENGRVTISARSETVTVNDNGKSSTQGGEEIPFVHLAISDSGAGIAPADRPHVFTPHYHAERALIPGLGDTGAGLASARSLTRANGGRIWVDSEEGKGTTFSLLFPTQLDVDVAEQAPLSPDVKPEVE